MDPIPFENKKCIIVLGMHRSGTSAFTGILNLLGANLGKNLMQTQSENERGFFENLKIFTVNEKILTSLGSSWDNLFPLPDKWWQKENMQIYKSEIKEIILQEFDSEIIAIKDPRLCLLLPIWLDVLNEMGIHYSFILPVRNPLEIAQSLKKRNGFSIEKSILLWAIYTCEAELYSRHYPRVFVSFDQLLSNTPQTISSIQKKLGLVFPKQFDESIQEFKVFLEPGLKHYNLETDVLNQNLLSSLNKWYQLLTELCSRDALNNINYSRIEVLKAEFQKVYNFFYHDDLIQLNYNKDKRINENVALLIDWEQTVKDLKHIIASNETKLAEYKSQLEVKDIVFDEQKRNLNEIERLLAEKEILIEELNGRLTEKEFQIVETNNIIANLNQQVNELFDSTSWKMTAPLRSLMNLLKRISFGFTKFIKGSIISFSKNIYYNLPLSDKNKINLHNCFFRFFGFALKGTLTYNNYLFKQNHLSLNNGTNQERTVLNYDKEAIRQSNCFDNITFIYPKKVNVSIIIPVFNQCHLTQNCLKSIFENTNDLGFEIIVIDDCSTDQTPEALKNIKGIQVIRNNANLGFLKSCNSAAQIAEGDYLVFLNNDTLVTSNWLDWLLKTFEIVPDAGLVGVKLIYPDGRLQEAGGIVWRDGSACNYGRLENPETPKFNYLREVDYCSGACIMVPKKLFMSLGLFDLRYVPAYYEDTDLAFRVRESGKKVIFQPHAQIIHFEGATSGTNTSLGPKRYQIINQTKFYGRWQNALQEHYDSNVPVEFAKERGIKKRILIIDVCICLPDQDSGSLRMYNLMRLLRESGYKITFYPDNLYFPQPYVTILENMGTEVLTEAIGSIEEYLRFNGEIFDVVLLSRFGVARKYVDQVRKYCKKSKLIFDTVDLHFVREKREAEIKACQIKLNAAKECKNQELEVAAKSDVTIVVSHEEKKTLKEENPNLDVKVLSNIHEIHCNQTKFGDRKDILFIGGFRHNPNVDAMIFFVKEIFPYIKSKLHDVKFYIIGSNPPEEIRLLASDDVIIYGLVADIDPYFNGCRLSVAPLRWGAGVKGKVNLSMSYGLPVVLTPIAAEGMFLTHGENALIATDAKEFANEVVKLYTDEQLWSKLSVNGIDNIKRHFSYEAAREEMKKIF